MTYLQSHSDFILELHSTARSLDSQASALGEEVEFSDSFGISTPFAIKDSLDMMEKFLPVQME